MQGCRGRSTSARQWLLKRPSATSILLGSPPYEVRSAGEGRGLGLYAARAIPAYSQILFEPPLILMKPTDDLPQLYPQYLALPADSRQTYLSLSHPETPQKDTLLAQRLRERGLGHGDNGDEKLRQMIKVANIMQTNAFNVDMADGLGAKHRALFPTVARINHSCLPNAHVCFYGPKTLPQAENGRGGMAIHALEDIKPGDEITIAYFSILLPRDQRTQRAAKWSFECSCAACTVDALGEQGVEKERASVTDFNAKLEYLMHSSRSTAAIKALIEMGTAIMSDIQSGRCHYHWRPVLPDLADGIARLRTKLSSLREEQQPSAEALRLLETSVLVEARITGVQSPAAKKRLEKLTNAARRGAGLPVLRAGAGGDLEVSWMDDG